MKVTVTDRAGGVHAKQGAPPLVIKIANGPPGVYKAVVTALNVPATGEAYSLSFATDAACTPGNLDTAPVVRQTLSNSQIANPLPHPGPTTTPPPPPAPPPPPSPLLYFPH